MTAETTEVRRGDRVISPARTVIYPTGVRTRSVAYPTAYSTRTYPAREVVAYPATIHGRNVIYPTGVGSRTITYPVQTNSVAYQYRY